MKEINYEELDSGIRDTVRFLRENGFNTTDSGDGTKTDMECAIKEPHVFMTCAKEELIDEADRLYKLIIDTKTEGYVFDIQANYNPGDGVGIIMFFGVV